MASSLTFNVVQYSPVSTSCVDVYNSTNTLQDQPAYITIAASNGVGTMSFSSDGLIHLQTGTTINFQTYTGDDVYNSQNDNVAFFKDGNTSLAMSIINNNAIGLGVYKSNNINCAWYLEPDTGGYNIYNESNGGMYLGYNSINDQIIVVPRTNKVIWVITQYPGVDSKAYRKALAFMNLGQGNYNNSFQSLPACVYPEETINYMNLSDCTLKVNGNTLNTNLVATQGIPITVDPSNPNNINQINQDILSGKSLYPSSGCGVTTEQENIFSQVVQDSGTAINWANQQILTKLENQISKLKSEIEDLKWNQIPNQQNLLNTATSNYQSILDDCNYQEWLTPWLNNVGLPWAQGLIDERKNNISEIQSVWNEVNDEGNFWSQKCKEAYSYVLLFEDCNYKGRVGTIPTGTTINLLENSWNDATSSISVPNGLKLTIWEDAISFNTGHAATVTGNVACLNDWPYQGHGGNWAKVISGVKVEGQPNPTNWNFTMQSLPPDQYQ